MEILENFLTMIEIGGPVMVPLGLVSSWLWVLIVVKADWIWRSNRKCITVHEALDCVKKDCLRPDSSCPRTLFLNYFITENRRNSKQNVSAEQLLLEVAVRRQMGTIYRFIPTIIILAATAPLLGLFGTVSGMVETFKVIGIYGMGNAQAMASGIREAMITTQAGLLVAIPGIFIGQVLKKKADHIQRDLLIFQRAISQWIERKYGS